MIDYRLVLYFCVLTACIFAVCSAGYYWWGGAQSSASAIWISIGGIAFLLLLALFGALIYVRLPLLSDVARQDRLFWQAMPATAQDVLGVLYDEKRFGPVVPHGWYGIRRLIVTVKYTDPKNDRVLFRATETPNKEHLDDTIRAFSTWIKTSKRYGAPAVYRAHKALHVLSDRHIREIEADPVGFVAKFQRHTQRGNPLPDPQDSTPN